ncbi:MAG: TonB-dependent receptor, partial [Gammaproteobacteria bacterium]|nr:TonB-dependent receptor [Gammaproteobacteria bacterium]
MKNKRPLSRLVVLSVAATALIHSMTAVAQSSDVVLEEIIVTAQKVAQQYLEVPVAVSTVTGEVLDMAKVTQFQDLVQVSPSVTFNQSGDQRGVGVLVRGIGTTAFQTTVEPTVSTVVDGVTLGRTAQFISNLVDIERVEVLRGPQGTLFGKNASAGLINVITKRP